jgi:hypothetical protein
MEAGSGLHPLPALLELLQRALVEEQPAVIQGRGRVSRRVFGAARQSAFSRVSRGNTGLAELRRPFGEETGNPAP